MAKTNYAFAKRQRDLLKKQKKEEKRQRKIDAQSPPAQETPPPPVVGAVALPLILRGLAVSAAEEKLE